MRDVGRLPLRALTATGLALLTPGCGGVDAAESSTLEVVAGFYPFAYVAERVAGENATVVNLTTPGVEPHDLALTPGQVVEISDADVAIYESGFQPSVDDAIEQNSPRITLDVTEVVPLRRTSAARSDATGASLDGDPHLWLDPTLLLPVAERLADDLADADPASAADFEENATALIEDLRDLDHDLHVGLADCQRREIVTSHAAFGYLADRYDLTMIAIAGLSPDVEPSPERLADIQDLVQSHGITTVFSETLGSTEYTETLADDLGVTAAVLDPVEGLADSSDGDDYLSLMRRNLAALRKANDCT